MTPVLAGGVEADEVHAPLAAEVSAVEPVPVLKLVPGLAPGQEVVVIADLAVRDTCGQCYKSNTAVIYCHFRLNYTRNIYNIKFTLE
jgi:hypothetical protein